MYNLNPFIFEAKDYDVDGIFCKFKKPEVALEIKWKKKVENKDIKKANENLSRIGAKRKIMFVPDKKGLKSKDIEIFDVGDIIKFYNTP